MQTIFLVFKNNFFRQFGDKKKFFLLLVFPIVSIIISIFIGNITNSEIRLGIINNTSTNSDVIKLLQDTQGISAKIITEDHAKRDTLLGTYDAIITFDNQTVDVYNIKNIEISESISQLVKTYKLSNKTIDFNEINSNNSDKNNSIVSFLFIILLITGVMNCSIIIKDREENILPRYLYSPNKLSQYIIGIGTYNFIITFIQILLSFVIANLVGKLNDVSVLIQFIYAISLSLIATAVSVFIISLFTRELLANLMAATISILLALLGGAFIPYNKMPTVLQYISNATPNRWIIKMTDWLEQGSKMHINPGIVLSIYAFGFIIISAFIFSHRKVEFK